MVYLGLSWAILVYHGLSQAISGYLKISLAISGYLLLSFPVSAYLSLFWGIPGLYPVKYAILGYLWLSWAISGHLGRFMSSIKYQGARGCRREKVIAIQTFPFFFFFVWPTGVIEELALLKMGSEITLSLVFKALPMVATESDNHWMIGLITWTT